MTLPNVNAAGTKLATTRARASSGRSLRKGRSSRVVDSLDPASGLNLGVAPAIAPSGGRVPPHAPCLLAVDHAGHDLLLGAAPDDCVVLRGRSLRRPDRDAKALVQREGTQD